MRMIFILTLSLSKGAYPDLYAILDVIALASR